MTNNQLLNWQDGLSTKMQAEVDSFQSIKRLKAGEMLFASGDQALFTYQIVSGHMSMTYNSTDGKEMYLSRISEGDCIGYRGVLSGSVRVGSVVADVDCTLKAMNGTDLLALCQEHTEVAMAINKVLCNQVRFLVSKVEEA